MLQKLKKGYVGLGETVGWCLSIVGVILTFCSIPAVFFNEGIGHLSFADFMGAVAFTVLGICMALAGNLLEEEGLGFGFFEDLWTLTKVIFLLAVGVTFLSIVVYFFGKPPPPP